MSPQVYDVVEGTNGPPPPPQSRTGASRAMSRQLSNGDIQAPNANAVMRTVPSAPPALTLPPGAGMGMQGREAAGGMMPGYGVLAGGGPRGPGQYAAGAGMASISAASGRYTNVQSAPAVSTGGQAGQPGAPNPGSNATPERKRMLGQSPSWRSRGSDGSLAGAPPPALTRADSFGAGALEALVKALQASGALHC